MNVLGPSRKKELTKQIQGYIERIPKGNV